MQIQEPPPPMYCLDYLATAKRCSEDEPPAYILPPPYTIITQQLQWIQTEEERLQIQEQRLNEQVRRLQTQVQRIKARQKPNPFCCCFRKPIKDARCCGVCYTFCYESHKEKRVEFCPASCGEYCVSGYIITNSGGVYQDDVCCCTVFCLPVKLVMFSPCLLGTTMNQFINCCRNTHANYLF